MDGLKECRWSRFAAGLLSYIEYGRGTLIKVDYKIDLDMPLMDILNELQTCSGIEELSPKLRKVAEEYSIYSKGKIE